MRNWPRPAVHGLSLAQADGRPPATLVAGSAAGESGVTVVSMRFRGGAHFSATPYQHLVWFQTSPEAHFDCRIAGRALRHVPRAGSLTICPAGAESSADAKGSVDAVVVAVDPGRFALAAAESSALEARLEGRLSGGDRELFGLAHTLVAESGKGYPNGPLFCNELADRFIEGLVARHRSVAEPRMRGGLGLDVLRRLRGYILAHLDQPIEVTALAGIAGRSPFHFSRVFVRSVGLTPHRYVVHLRLQCAIELIHAGRWSLAEVAARTGFADQSHLSRWVRRVHGVALSQIAG